MKKNHRTHNALLISVAAHVLFITIGGLFIKTTYEPVQEVAIEWVKAPPIQLKPRQKLPQAVLKPAGAPLKSPSKLPVRSARKSLHEIPEVTVEDVNIVRESVEINRDAKVSDISPIVATSSRFDTHVETRDTIALPTATPTLVEAPGKGQQINRVRAAGSGDTQGIADVDSFGTARRGITGRGAGGGDGLGDGGIGDGFADVGIEAPKVIDIDSKKSDKKDIFGIGEYVEETREGEQQVIYVLDVSTSMNRKRKLELAVQALKNAIAMLKKGDHFNIITFDKDIRMYSQKMLPVTRVNVKRAYDYLDSLEIRSGTHLSAALELALSLKSSTIVVISDGDPSRGITNSKQLLAFVRERNRKHARIMTIALGKQHTVRGVKLLKQLAAQNNGHTTLINIQ